MTHFDMIFNLMPMNWTQRKSNIYIYLRHVTLTTASQLQLFSFCTNFPFSICPLPSPFHAAFVFPSLHVVSCLTVSLLFDEDPGMVAVVIAEMSRCFPCFSACVLTEQMGWQSWIPPLLPLPFQPPPSAHWYPVPGVPLTQNLPCSPYF